MKHKRFLCFITLVVIILQFPLCFFPIQSSAVTINDSTFFLKEEYESGTCTLVAAAMLLRRSSYLKGDSDWRSVTKASVRSTIWSEANGLLGDFTYKGIHIKRASFNGSQNDLINILKEHPEGIVAYRYPTAMHAVLLTDYSNGIFYAADPADNFPSGRIPLTSCYSVRADNINYYWYVVSPKLGGDNTKLSTPKVSVNKSTATTDDTIKISCNAVDNATWYWMSLYKDDKLYINQALDNSLNFSKKLPVGSYKADISAHNDYADSESGSVSFTVKSPNLDSPKIKVETSFDTNTSNHVIKVTWDKIPNADNYIINYGIEGSAASREKELGNTTSDTYTLGKDVLNNQGTSVGFWFKVKAKNSSGASSDWSNINTVYLYPGCYGIHNYGSWSTSKAATCTADGTQIRKCSKCTYSESKVIPKTGHSLGDWTTSKAATCTADGTQIRKCSKCSYSEEKAIPKTGHKYTDSIVAPTCTEKGYTKHTCSVCKDSYNDKETNAKGHTFTSKKIGGYMTYVCSDCGFMYTAPFEGEGTAEFPFIISNADELRAVSDTVNNTELNQIFGHAYYKQTADIDLENISWTPIGLGYDGEDGRGAYNYTTRMFFGVYDGNQHTIYNLNVDKEWHYSGLFATIRYKHSKVCNLVVYGNVVSGRASGGITGETHYYSSIENCAFIGNVNGTQYAGGIVGRAYNGATLKNCYHNGSVTSEKNAGGISGATFFNNLCSVEEESIIENCYHANGEVTGEECGAIVGICIKADNTTMPTTIKNCYASKSSNYGERNEGATYDDTMLLPDSFLKKIAEDLGDAYIDNTNLELNNGFPVFPWQLVITLKGDADNNGVVDVNDAIMLQDWLLGASEELTNWENVDLCEDGRIDVFDLVLLRQILVEG